VTTLEEALIDLKHHLRKLDLHIRAAEEDGDEDQVYRFKHLRRRLLFCIVRCENMPNDHRVN